MFSQLRYLGDVADTEKQKQIPRRVSDICQYVFY